MVSCDELDPVPVATVVAKLRDASCAAAEDRNGLNRAKIDSLTFLHELSSFFCSNILTRTADNSFLFDY